MKARKVGMKEIRNKGGRKKGRKEDNKEQK